MAAKQEGSFDLALNEPQACNLWPKGTVGHGHQHHHHHPCAMRISLAPGMCGEWCMQGAVGHGHEATTARPSTPLVRMSVRQSANVLMGSPEKGVGSYGSVSGVTGADLPGGGGGARNAAHMSSKRCVRASYCCTGVHMTLHTAILCTARA